MKWLFGALAVMLASVAVTLMVSKDNGYVLIGYGVWTVEGSLAFFVLLNLLLFLLLYWAIRAMNALWSVPGNVRDWNDRRLTKKAHRFMVKGLVELAEGEWRAAEKSLLRHVENSETPLLNYLAAARAAQSLGAHERRDHHLQLAHESMPSADVAVGLTQAELQLAHQQMEQALATLMHLRSIAPKHKYVLKLLRSLYENLGDWRQLALLLPELRKHKVFSSDELEGLEVDIQSRLMAQVAAEKEPEALHRFWESLSKVMRKDSRLVYEYACFRLQQGRGDQIGDLLRDALVHKWDDRLVSVYGLIEGDDVLRLLANGEEWLLQRPHDPILLLALGRLALRARIWGKARNYLEASIGAEPSVEAYRELGALLERQEEKDESVNCYRKGLELATRGSSPKSQAAPRLLGSRSLIRVTDEHVAAPPVSDVAG
jgi:HemY protein